MLSTPQFEIDEEGQPWWIAPRIIKTIGLFGGTDIKGAVLCNAVTGESQYYEEVPAWVDNVYTPELIMEQYDYHGTLINGFINSILGLSLIHIFPSSACSGDYGMGSSTPSPLSATPALT